MAVRRKVWWWVGVPLALLLLAGAVAYMAYLSVQDKPGRTVVFPDGSRLTVLGASRVGQAFTTDKPWQALLRRWLPGTWQSRLPVPVTVPATPLVPYRKDIWVWLKCVDAGGTNISESLDKSRQLQASARAGGGFYPRSAPSPAPRQEPWTRIALVSKDGFRMEAPHNFQSLRAGGGTQVGVLQLYAFPRRQREFEVEFIDKHGKVLGSVSVPNPDRGPFPEWEPERLPITRTNGPLVVTLEGLTETTPQSGLQFAPPVTPKYRLESADAEWRQTNQVGVWWWWTDATGNVNSALDWREKAWKLSMSASRIKPTHFLEEERFAVSGLKVPEPGTMQVLTNEFERRGMKFKFYGLVGAGTLAITNGRLSMVSSNRAPIDPRGIGGYLLGDDWTIIGFAPTNTNQPAGPLWTTFSTASHAFMVTTSNAFFLLEGSQPNSTEDVQFRVVGADGQELRPSKAVESMGDPSGLSGTLSGTWPTNRTYLIEFDGTKASGTVSLEVTVNLPRAVEFFVDPRDVRR